MTEKGGSDIVLFLDCPLSSFLYFLSLFSELIIDARPRRHATPRT
jgi:hypothetical protein